MALLGAAAQAAAPAPAHAGRGGLGAGRPVPVHRGLRTAAPRQYHYLSKAPRPVQAASAEAPEPLMVDGELPFVGHLLKMDLTNMHESVERMHQENGTQVLRLKMFSKTFVHTRNADDIAQVFKDAENFRKPEIMHLISDWLGEGLATQKDIPKHAEQRRLLNPAFRMDYIAGLNPVFSEVGERLADAILEQGQTNIQDMAMRATIDIIGKTGFRTDFGSLDLGMGKRTAPLTMDTSAGPVDVAALFDKLVGGAGNIFAFSSLPFMRREWVPGYKDYASAIKSLDDVIDSVIAERRKEGIIAGDLDLVSFCLRAMEQDSTIMNDKQIRNELHTMLFAGSDTTANTLSWMFYELARRPEAARRCTAEVDAFFEEGGKLTPEQLNKALPYITACFKETLRLYPPVTLLSRTPQQETVLEGTGVKVTPSTGVFTNIWSVHRNPEYWKRPLEFCPERWLPEGEAEFGVLNEKAWVPFGGGSRICIGKYFAIMEGQVIALQVLRKVAFAPVEGFQPVVRNAVTLTSTNGILVRAEPRRTAPSKQAGSTSPAAAGAV